MKSGRCPKCQSTEIRVGPAGGIRQVIMNTFSISFWRNATPERYVCVSCGYMEQYVSDPADRRTIAAKWPDHST
jgi:Zn ribbon nucleic-acid-binding protein